MDRLNRELKGGAVMRGLCAQWTGRWNRDLSKDELMDMYVEGIDFCIERDWPSVEYMTRNFSRSERNRHGIFVNEKVGHVGTKAYVLNGYCDGSVMFGVGEAVSMYVRHNSKIEIQATNNARVFVSVYDNAEVAASADMGAKVFIYKHSDRCSIKTNGDVHIRC